MEKKYNAFEFNDEVKSRIEKRLMKYSLQHVAEVDNTYQHPDKREHFCSTNIYSLLCTIFRTYNIFSVSRAKYKLEDYDAYDIGEAMVQKNRRNFLDEIDSCEDILQFIFLTFNFR